MQARPQVTYPGVYVQEVPSGVRTIVGVSTSTAMFMGRIAGGILNKPVRCLNYSDFANNFSEDISVGDMARYVKLFFLNGGTDCYVMRLAKGAQAASVTLQSVDNTDRIRLIAKQQGTLGENIRASVTYASRYPEVTFNATIFRWEKDTAGNRVKKDVEEWKGLSMDPNSPLYAVDFLTQESKLVKAERVGNHDPSDGFSLAGRPVAYDNSAAANRRDAWQAVAGKFGISTDGSSYSTVNFDAIDFTGISTTSLGSVKTDLENEIKVKINEATLIPVADITVTIMDGPAPPGSAAPKNTTDMLKITLSKRDVFIRPAGSNDMAVPMMFGSEQGGLEVGAFAYLRPVPTGISLNIGGNNGNVYTALLKISQKNVSQVTLPEMQADGTFADKNIPVNLKTTGPNDPMYVDKKGGAGGLREKLEIIRDEINKYREKNPTKFFWKADLWGLRLAITATKGGDNSVGTFKTGTVTDISTFIAGSVKQNVRYYSVGTSGIAGFQTTGNAGIDGSSPEKSDYEAAFKIIEKKVDIFNLMILPPDRDKPDLVQTLYGTASVFCQKQRAFLLMDAPSAWSSAQQASEEVAAKRIGLVKDYSAMYFPRLIFRESGRKVNIGASGAIAGLMARIDGSRGVWKAPAGTEADLRGVVGLEHSFSDAENGILNPRGINTVRVFPNGIVSWGARTMDGDNDFASEWKYIPVRRLSLYIEESLYRGLKWVVFEPNDEPLWAQIRLNVGAFMHDLFKQGAFQGQKAKDAYFVKCDSETTTQNDINLGIVNIWVGFAPLKPAEFVILYLQQMSGQVEV